MTDEFPGLDKLVSAFPTTSTLFHYTTQEGLLGILKEGALWLSSIRHLSDAMEFGYAIELVRTSLKQRLKAEQGPRNSYYAKVLTRLDAIKDMTLFVGSFSEHADLLSQWRAYASQGVGFSIGFNYDDLKMMAAQQGLNIMKCVYGPQEHDSLVANLIDLAGTLANGDDEKAVTAFFIGLFKFAPAVKDPSFFEEREWRVVTDVVMSRENGTKFKAGKSMLIPYREFNLAVGNQKMPIRRVIVGPTPHMDLSISSLTHLLFTSDNVDNTWTIAPSRVPYRSW